MFRARRSLPALASAALLFYAFIPEWGFLPALAALVPFFRSLVLDPDPWSTLGFATTFSVSYFFWLRVFSPAAPVLMAAIHSAWIILGIFPAYILARKKRPGAALAVLPFGWVASEWIRSFGPYGYEWGTIGYTQYGSLTVAAFSAYGGIWLVSFLVVLSNVIFTWITLKRVSSRWIALILFALLLWFLSPSQILSNDWTAARPFALVQTNMSPYRSGSDREQEMETQLGALADEASSVQSKCVILPETVFSTEIVGLGGVLTEEAARVLRGFLEPNTGRMLLVGAIERDPDRMYNSAILLNNRGERVTSYRKRHLVPLGETIPRLEHLEWAQAVGRALGTPFFSAGDTTAPIQIGGRRAGILICFEGTFSRLVAESARDADLLINISNDAWSESEFGHEQHLRFLRFRAIETGLPVLRVGNSGPSALFAPNGSLVARISHPNAAVLDLSKY